MFFRYQALEPTAILVLPGCRRRIFCFIGNEAYKQGIMESFIRHDSGAPLSETANLSKLRLNRLASRTIGGCGYNRSV